MFVALPQNCLFNLGAADLSGLLYAGHEATIHIEIVATCAKRVANLRVLRRLSPEGGGKGGGHGPPLPSLDPPLTKMLLFRRDTTMLDAAFVILVNLIRTDLRTTTLLFLRTTYMRLWTKI